MNRLIILITALATSIISSSAQEQEATLSNGTKVILKPDGSWTLKTKQGSKPAAHRAAEPIPVLGGGSGPRPMLIQHLGGSSLAPSARLPGELVTTKRAIKTSSDFFEDDEVKVSFTFEPGSISVQDRSENNPCQQLRVIIQNKSATKIGYYKLGLVHVEDNYGNVYIPDTPITGAGQSYDTLPGQSKSFTVPITSTILPNAESLQIRIDRRSLEGSYAAAMNPQMSYDFQVLVSLKGAQITTATPKSGRVDGTHYEDDQVTVDFIYQPHNTKGVGQRFSNSILVRIANVSLHKILIAETHQGYGTLLVSNLHSIEDNFGNKMSITDVSPVLSKKEIVPGEKESTTITFTGILLPSAKSVNMIIPPRLFGNRRRFLVSVPLDSSKKGFVYYNPN